jgi:hypothetical protein
MASAFKEARMSGRKESSFQLDQERQRRAGLLREIQASRRELQGTCDHIDNTLRNESQDLLRFINDTTCSSREWMRISRTYRSGRKDKRFGMHSQSAMLEEELGRLQALVEEGRAIRKTLLSDVSEASCLRDSLIQRTTITAAFFDEHRELVERHSGIRTATRLTKKIQEAVSTAQRAPLTLGKLAVDSLETEVEDTIDSATHTQEMGASAKAVAQFDKCLSVVRFMLSSLPDGARAAWPIAVARAEEWLEGVEGVNRDPSRIDSASSTGQLEKTRKRVEDFAKSGRDVAASLQQILSEDAPTRRARLAELISPLDVLLRGSRELLATWLGDEEVEHLENRLGTLQSDAKADRFDEVATSCDSLRDEIDAALVRAQDMELKHERRLYLLDALKEVCTNMGFRVSGEPRMERQGDLASRMVLTTDAPSAGRVTFYLALDSIEADSRISRSYCLDEFNELSAQLKEEFGVHTDFRMSPGPAPSLARKDQKRLPDTSQSVREADSSAR